MALLRPCLVAGPTNYTMHCVVVFVRFRRPYSRRQMYRTAHCVDEGRLVDDRSTSVGSETALVDITSWGLSSSPSPYVKSMLRAPRVRETVHWETQFFHHTWS